jgi:methyl-accepting chemotaxis protein
MSHINFAQAVVTSGSAVVAFSIIGAFVSKLISRSFKDTATETVAAALKIATEALTERIDASDTKTDELRKSVDEKLDKIKETVQAQAVEQARQFGGNGGGMRQALNEHGAAIANLAGQFEQHLRQGAHR